MKDLEYLIELRDKYEFMKDTLEGELNAGKYKRCNLGKRVFMNEILKEYQAVYALIEDKLEQIEPR